MTNEFKEILFDLIRYIEENIIKYGRENILFERKEEYKKRFFISSKDDTAEDLFLPGLAYLNKFIRDFKTSNQLDEIHTENNIKLTFNEFIMYVEQFCDFLLFADVALFYKNDEKQSIYAEKLNEDKRTIYFKTENFKLRIDFESTEIPDIPNITRLLQGENKNLQFIHINIVREYGKKFNTSCKFVGGEDITFESKESMILFVIVSNLMKNTIIDSYKSIVQKALQDYFNIKEINLDKLLGKESIYIRNNQEKKKFNYYGDIDDE